jgi:large subunit ribosomal protein L21
MVPTPDIPRVSDTRTRGVDNRLCRSVDNGPCRPVVCSERGSALAGDGTSSAVIYFLGQAMFAVIRTGGKQYRVSENAHIQVERLAGSPGDTVTFDDVLMLGGSGGESPVLGGTALGSAAVFAEVLAQIRDDKVLIFKKKRRKNHRRMRGHRQNLTVLRITGISPSGEMPAAAAAETAPAASEEFEAPAPDDGEASAPLAGEGEAKE